MRTFTLACFIIILFASCKSYQYLTLSASDASLSKDNKFVKESDSLRITYDFSGLNGPFEVHIYNKLSDPIEIDWRRSSLIIGDKPIALSPSELKLNGEISRTSYSRPPTASIQADIEQPVGVEFIPPRTEVRKAGLYLNTGPFALESYPKTEDKIKADAGLMKKMSKTRFDSENSPYRVRVYLTFAKPGRPHDFISVEEEFYLVEIMETNATPAYVLSSPQPNGNRFYVHKSNRMAGWGLGLGIATVLLIVAGTP